MPEGLDVEALGFDLTEPRTDLMMNGLNAYFGGVHAIAWKKALGTERQIRAGTVLSGMRRKSEAGLKVEPLLQ